MRSTLARSMGAVAAGAVLLLAPVGAAFADDHLLVPDDTLAFDNSLLQETTWEDILLDDWGIVATCTKDDSIDDPYTIPAEPVDSVWVLAVLKGGAGEEAHELYYDPMPGDLISHGEAGNSNVILCSEEIMDETPTTPVTSTTTTPVTSTTTTSTSTTTTGTSTTTTGTTTTTTPVTGPVVETDRPAGGDLSQVGLFAGAAALLAAGAAVVLGRRRQSAEH